MGVQYNIIDFINHLLSCNLIPTSRVLKIICAYITATKFSKPFHVTKSLHNVSLSFLQNEFWFLHAK